ncbi:MAG: hypothetical protein RBR82_15800 [Pseudomonas sp.]|nr:hypothetical protein [Pseudomonas sp.]
MLHQAAQNVQKQPKTDNIRHKKSTVESGSSPATPRNTVSRRFSVAPMMDSEHEQWLNLKDHQQALGDGYRDGFAGVPPRGFHGNLGNLNAQGDLPADSSIQLRVNSQIKASYVKQAQREGLKLSAWIIKTLDAEVTTK